MWRNSLVKSLVRCARPTPPWRRASGRSPVSKGGALNFLGADRRDLAKHERRALLRLRTLVMDGGLGGGDDLEVLTEAADQLDELFMVAFLGEFNAGKSTVINALLGDSYCKEGVVPTTSKVCILRYSGDAGPRDRKYDDGVDELALPVPWLDDVALVDTPGTNAIIHGHAEITERVIPKADLVFFVTSADRPFSESERVFLERIRAWRKKVVLVINKMDLFETDEDQRQVVEFVRINGASLLGASSPVFAVSAKKALRAKKAAHPSTDPRMGYEVSLWEESGFEALEEHVKLELSEESKIRNKLLSPLGVADTIAARAETKVQERQEVMRGDWTLLEMIDEQLASFMADMKRDTDYQKLQVEKVLLEMQGRVERYLDDKVTLGNIAGLVDGDSFRQQFDRTIKGDTAEAVDSIIKYMADLVAKRARAQSAAVMEYVGRRPRHKDSIIGSLSNTNSFYDDREKLIERLQGSVASVWSGVDQHEQLQRVSVAVNSSLTQTAAIGAGATTIGGLAVAGILGDITGIIATSGLALAAILVLPAQKWRQKRDFRLKVDEVKKNMDRALEQHLERELQRVQDGILEGIAPYRRFVDVEQEKLEKHMKALKAVQNDLKQLRQEIA